MEIKTSKFRSPPPKPPRRRSSDQLSNSPTGTYPSTRIKYIDQNNLCLKTQPNEEKDFKCESLPTTWITNFYFDQHTETAATSRNAIRSSSARIKKSYFHYFASTGNSSGLSEKNSETNPKKTLTDQTIKGVFYSDYALKNTVSSKCFKNVLDINSNKNSSYNFDQTSNKFDTKCTKYYHRRHNSDPVLSLFKNSNISLSNHSPESLSFMSSSAEKNHLSAFNLPYTSKECEYLLEEIKHLKTINKKLWEHLYCTQACLDKITKNSEETAICSVSELLSSLYSSQKAKDKAMEDRIKVIMDHRNIAIQELDDLIHIIAKSFGNESVVEEEEEKYSEKEIKDILGEIESTYDPTKLLQQQRLLLTFLYRLKELKQDRIMHDFKLSVKESNHLQEKVKNLEKKLNKQLVCCNMWNTENRHWENNLLKILCQVIQQRDVALSKGSWFQNSEARSYKCNDSTTTFKRNVQSSYHDVKCEQFSIDSSTEEIRLLKGEIMFLSVALEKETSKRQYVEEKCLRLERLVNVLRKKVNGQNVGIPV